MKIKTDMRCRIRNDRRKYNKWIQRYFILLIYTKLIYVEVLLKNYQVYLII